MDEFSLDDFGDPDDFGALFENPPEQLLSGDDYTADDLIAAAEADQWSPLHSPQPATSTPDALLSAASTPAHTSHQPASTVAQEASGLPCGQSALSVVAGSASDAGLITAHQQQQASLAVLHPTASSHSAVTAQAPVRPQSNAGSVGGLQGINFANFGSGSGGSVVQLNKEQLSSILQQQAVKAQQTAAVLRAQQATAVISGPQPAALLSGQQLLQTSGAPLASNAAHTVSLLADGKQTLQTPTQANQGQLTLQNIQSALIQASPQVGSRQIIIQAPGQPTQQINLATLQQLQAQQQQGLRLVNIQNQQRPIQTPIKPNIAPNIAQSNLISLNTQGGPIILQRAPAPSTGPIPAAQNIVLRAMPNSSVAGVQQFQNIAPQPQPSQLQSQLQTQQLLISHGGQLRQIQIPAGTNLGALQGQLQLQQTVSNPNVAATGQLQLQQPVQNLGMAAQVQPTTSMNLQAHSQPSVLPGQHSSGQGQSVSLQSQVDVRGMNVSHADMNSHMGGQSVVSQTQHVQQDASRIGGLQGYNVGNNIQNLNILTSQAQVINVLGPHQSGQKLVGGLTVNLGGQLVNLQNVPGLNVSQLNQLKGQLLQNIQSHQQDNATTVSSNFGQATSSSEVQQHAVVEAVNLEEPLGSSSSMPITISEPATESQPSVITSQTIAASNIPTSLSKKLSSLTPQQIETLRAQLWLRKQQQIEQQKQQQQLVKQLSSEELQLPQVQQPNQSSVQQQLVCHTQASVPSSLQSSNLQQNSTANSMDSQQTLLFGIADKIDSNETSKSAVDIQSIQPKREFKGLQDLQASQIKIIGDTIHTVPSTSLAEIAPNQNAASLSGKIPSYNPDVTVANSCNGGLNVATSTVGNLSRLAVSVSSMSNSQRLSHQLASSSIPSPQGQKPDVIAQLVAQASAQASAQNVRLGASAHAQDVKNTDARLGYGVQATTASSSQTLAQLLGAQSSTQTQQLQAQIGEIMQKASLRPAVSGPAAGEAVARTRPTDSLAALLACDEDDEENTQLNKPSESANQKPSVNVAWPAHTSGTAKQSPHSFDAMLSSHAGHGTGEALQVQIQASRAQQGVSSQPPTPQQVLSQPLTPKSVTSQPATPFQPPTPQGHMSFQPPTPQASSSYRPPTPQTTPSHQPPTPKQPPTPNQYYQPSTPKQPPTPQQAPPPPYKPPTPGQGYQPPTPKQPLTPRQPPTPQQSSQPPTPSQPAPSYQPPTPSQIAQGPLPSPHLSQPPTPQGNLAAQLQNQGQTPVQSQSLSRRSSIEMQTPLQLNLPGAGTPTQSQAMPGQPEAQPQMVVQTIQLGSQQISVSLSPRYQQLWVKIKEQIDALQALPQRDDRQQQLLNQLMQANNKIVQHAVKQQLLQQLQGQQQQLGESPQLQGQQSHLGQSQQHVGQQHQLSEGTQLSEQQQLSQGAQQSQQQQLGNTSQLLGNGQPAQREFGQPLQLQQQLLLGQTAPGSQMRQQLGSSLQEQSHQQLNVQQQQQQHIQHQNMLDSSTGMVTACRENQPQPSSVTSSLPSTVAPPPVASGVTVATAVSAVPTHPMTSSGVKLEPTDVKPATGPSGNAATSAAMGASGATGAVTTTAPEIMTIAKQKIEALIENFPAESKQQLLKQLECMSPEQKKQFYETQLGLLLRLQQRQQARKLLLEQHKQQQQQQQSNPQQQPAMKQAGAPVEGGQETVVTPAPQMPSIKVEVPKTAAAVDDRHASSAAALASPNLISPPTTVAAQKVLAGETPKLTTGAAGGQQVLATGAAGGQQVLATGASASQFTAEVQRQMALRVKPALHRFSRGQLFHLQLNKDQLGALKPDCRTPFSSYKDVIKRLLKYHVMQTGEPASRHMRRAEDDYEEYSQLVVEKTEDMLAKYQQLLLDESMRTSPSSEMVMIERMFLADERLQLEKDKRQARDDPHNFKPTPYIPRTEGESISEEESEAESEDSVVVLDYSPKVIKQEDRRHDAVVKTEPDADHNGVKHEPDAGILNTANVTSCGVITSRDVKQEPTTSGDVISACDVKQEPALASARSQPVPSPSYCIESGIGLRMTFKASPCPSPAPESPAHKPAQFSDISEDEGDAGEPLAKRARAESVGQDGYITARAAEPSASSFANQFEQFLRAQSNCLEAEESSSSSSETAAAKPGMPGEPPHNQRDGFPPDLWKQDNTSSDVFKPEIPMHNNSTSHSFKAEVSIHEGSNSSDSLKAGISLRETQLFPDIDLTTSLSDSNQGSSVVHSLGFDIHGENKSALERLLTEDVQENERGAFVSATGAPVGDNTGGQSFATQFSNQSSHDSVGMTYDHDVQNAINSILGVGDIGGSMGDIGGGMSGIGGSVGDIGRMGDMTDNSDDVLNDVAEVIGGLDSSMDASQISQQDQDDLNAAVNSIL